MEAEVQSRKDYFKNFLSQKAGAYGNDIEKERQKPRTKALYLSTSKIKSKLTPKLNSKF